MSYRLTRGRLVVYSLIGIIFLVLTGGVGWYVFSHYFQGGGETTEVRSRAASVLGTVKLTMETESTSRYSGDIFFVDLYLDTAGTAVSGVAFQIGYNSGAGASPNLMVIDLNADVAGTQILSLADSIDPCLSDQINTVERETKAGDKKVTIDFSLTCLSTSGYKTPATGRVKIARIAFMSTALGQITLEQDPGKAIAIAKSGDNAGMDVLQTVPPLTLTFVNDTQKPTVQFDQGPAAASTVIDRNIKFTVKAVDKPDRPSDTLITYPGFLRYRFSEDGVSWSAWSNDPIYEKVRPHGLNTIHAQVTDAANNLSDPISRYYYVNLKPVVESLTPASAPAGTDVTIKGYNFGPTQYYVYFGTALGTVKKWTNTEIVATVPATANGAVRVWVYNIAGEDGYSEVKDFLAETTIGLNFNVKGITTNVGARKVKITVETATDVVAELSNQEATWNTTSSSYRVVTSSLPNDFVSGYYTVTVKGDNTLRRKFTQVYLYKGKLNELPRHNKDEWKLIIGDFNNDNKINIVDFGKMMTYVTKLTTPVSDKPESVIIDINGDGNITFTDIALILSGYNKLEVLGD